MFVPVGDPAALTATLIRVIQNPVVASALGRAARESVREYTWERSTKQFLAACHAAVGRQSEV
jgi:glycosyltransferase involved in cell wall biosynthesis